jgi:hypothetical protein
VACGIVDYLLEMLHERYIISLPRLKRDKNKLCNRSPKHLSWLWYFEVAKLLDCKERQLEGHPNSFYFKLYIAPKFFLDKSHSKIDGVPPNIR